MLQTGQTAPNFTLPDADMESVSLGKFRNKKHVVLYFYPRDGTPGCTIQATEFSDLEEEFAKRDCIILGVSPDDCLRHAEFRDAAGISIRLLADPEHRVCEQYQVLQTVQGTDAGPARRTVSRATYVIDRQGIVRHALGGVSPKGHAQQVLALVKGLKA